MTRRKKAVQRGFRKSYSLSRLIIEELALHWVTRRDFLSRTAVNFHRDSEDEEVPEKQRRSILQQVSNILNQLKRKHLVFIVPRRLVVNVPKVLYLYYINLPPEERKPEKMWSNNRTVNHRALYLSSGPLRSPTVGLSEEESIKITNTIVTRYYINNTIYHGYLYTLYTFLKHMSKFFEEINKEVNQIYLTKKVEMIIFSRILDIISNSKTHEVIEGIRCTIREITGNKLFNNLMDSWGFLVTKIHGLTYDPDPRIRSSARLFMDIVIQSEIASILIP